MSDDRREREARYALDRMTQDRDRHAEENARLRAELKERKGTLGALVQHWRRCALDRAATIARVEALIEPHMGWLMDEIRAALKGETP